MLKDQVGPKKEQENLKYMPEGDKVCHELLKLERMGQDLVKLCFNAS